MSLHIWYGKGIKGFPALLADKPFYTGWVLFAQCIIPDILASFLFGRIDQFAFA